jgi:hypothetical protein
VASRLGTGNLLTFFTVYLQSPFSLDRKLRCDNVLQAENGIGLLYEEVTRSRLEDQIKTNGKQSIGTTHHPKSLLGGTA